MISTTHLSLSDSGIISLRPDGPDLGAVDDIDLCPHEYVSEWRELLSHVLADDCLGHLSHAVWSELVDAVYGSRPRLLPIDVATGRRYPPMEEA